MIWNLVFYLTALIVLVAATGLVFIKKPMHAVVYLVITLLGLAVIYYLLGSAFLAALQIMLYVGAMMVLYVFFIMLSPQNCQQGLSKGNLVLPGFLLTLLFTTFIVILYHLGFSRYFSSPVVYSPVKMGITLYQHYKIAIEAISALLLAALVGVIYLARQLDLEVKST